MHTVIQSSELTWKELLMIEFILWMFGLAATQEPTPKPLPPSGGGSPKPTVPTGG